MGHPVPTRILSNIAHAHKIEPSRIFKPDLADLPDPVDLADLTETRGQLQDRIPLPHTLGARVEVAQIKQTPSNKLNQLVEPVPTRGKHRHAMATMRQELVWLNQPVQPPTLGKIIPGPPFQTGSRKTEIWGVTCGGGWVIL